VPAYKLTLEYDGAGFSGWQKQPGRRTAQGALEDALATMLRGPARVQGASRTDAGVHALGQVASFEREEELDPGRLVRGLSAICRPDLAVVEAAVAPPGFNARFDSRGKRYEYAILNRSAPSPMAGRASWHVPRPLDVDAMREAAGRIVGTHDFAGFRAADCGREDTVRTITLLEIGRGDLERITFVVEGTGFLKYMVRIMVGTLVGVGLGRLPPGVIDELFESRDRARAGQTAPPHGLTLVKVFY